MSHTIACRCRESDLAVFEENYRLLLGLLPGLRVRDRFSLTEPEGRSSVDIEVLERHRYTLMVRITKPFRSVLPDLTMTVRLCLDAEVAEVVAYQDCTRVPACFEIEGQPQYHRGEKRRSNELLRELLAYCFYRDYSVTNPSAGFTSA